MRSAGDLTKGLEVDSLRITTSPKGCRASLGCETRRAGQRDQMSLCSSFSPWTRVA
jgi:hypothetical protein